MANTGRKIYQTLKKVSNDVNEYPLDTNNNRCDITGLPQATKLNSITDPDYVPPIMDTGLCPLPTTTLAPGSYTLGLYEQFQGSGTDTLIYAELRDENGDPANATVDIVAQGTWINRQLSTSFESEVNESIVITAGNSRLNLVTYDNSTHSCGNYHVVDINPSEMNGRDIVGL